MTEPAQSSLHEVPCNVCSGLKVAEVFPAGKAQKHRVVRCLDCGLLYASPRTAEHEHTIRYDADIDFTVDLAAAARVKKEILQLKDYARTRQLLKRLHPERGRLLEIGSSFGFLLASFAEDGFQTVGVDPFDGACRYAMSRFGLDIRIGVLDEAGIEPASCDVVVMNHVIEHLPDPLGTLRQIHGLLKPGGHLVVETPRYDTLTFKLLGWRERSMRCDGHIYFFTNRSLGQLAEKAGFRVIDRRTTGRRLTLDRLAWNLGVMSGSAGARRGLDRLLRSLRLDRLSLYINARDIQRVCLERVEARSIDVAR